MNWCTSAIAHATNARRNQFFATTRMVSKRSQDYQITTPEGHVASYGVAISGHRPWLAVGQAVKALYQPSDPDDVRLDDGQERFLGRFFLGLSPTGLATSALGVYLWLRQRRLPRSSQTPAGA